MSDPAPAVDPVQAPIDNIRATVKWIIAVFAAVGAALIAGTQLASIGHLTGFRLALALFGVAIGLIGVGLVISGATPVLRSVASLLSDFAITSDPTASATRLFLDQHPDVFRGHATSVIDLSAKYNTAVLDRGAAQQKLDEAPVGNLGDLPTRLSNAQGRVQRVSAVVNQVLSIANYEIVDRKFANAQRWLLIGGAIAAAGIVVLTLAANPPPLSPMSSGSLQNPTLVKIVLSEQGRNELRPVLGDHCNLSDLQGLALGGAPSSWEIATLPSPGCQSIRVTLTDTLGTAVPASRVDVPQE